MKPLITLAIIAITFSSCTQYYCYPSKRSKDYAVLKEGTISKDYLKARCVSVTRTMKGWKHSFMTDANQSVERYYQCRLAVGSDYWILVTHG